MVKYISNMVLCEHLNKCGKKMDSVTFLDTFDELVKFLYFNQPQFSSVILRPGVFMKLSEDHMRQLGNLLKNNTAVRHMHLSHDEIPWDFLSEIQRGLAYNSTLIKLSINKTGHNSTMLQAIETKIANNRSQILQEEFKPPLQEDYAHYLLELAANHYTDMELFELAKYLIAIDEAHGLYALISAYPQLLNITEKNGLLYEAVERLQINCVKALLMLGGGFAKHTLQIDLALICAVKKGDFVLINLLIKNGANVQIDHNGFTPFFHVRSSEIGNLLIEYGADVFYTVDPMQTTARRFHGNTALHAVLYFEPSYELLEYLLNLGIAVNAQNSLGQTVLHLLYCCGYLEENELLQRINLLISFGANPLIRDNLERTPLDLAISYNRNVSLLKRVTRDYLSMRNQTNVLKQGIRTQGFFGTPPEIIEQITLMAASTESLDQNACKAIIKHYF